MEGSYDVTSIAIDTEKEISRLNAQLDLFWDQEFRLYNLLGLKDGMAVLDCGCGPGYLLQKLHTIFPTLQCTGIEVSNTLVEHALKKVRQHNLSRCNIFQQSVTALDFPDNSFDFVIMRLVLEHLPDPFSALHQIRRVLKKGGRALFIDNDFEFHPHTFPQTPELTELYQAYCTARCEEGGNPTIGRQLPAILLKAGFSEVSLDVLCAHNAITGDAAFSRSEGAGIALQLVHSGHLKASTYDDLATHWSAMLQQSGHSIVRILFAASGLKTNDVLTVESPIMADNQTAQTSKKLTLQQHIESGTLTSGLITAVADVLEINASEIHEDTPLGSYGIDSVASVMLRNLLEAELHFKIPSVGFFTNHSICEIIQLQSEQRAQKNTSLPAASTEPPMIFEEGTL